MIYTACLELLGNEVKMAVMVLDIYCRAWTQSFWWCSLLDTHHLEDRAVGESMTIYGYLTMLPVTHIM
jgi:hypothetical protein